MGSVSVVIPHYYRQRDANLSKIVDALMTGSVTPDEIVIWNNDVGPLAVDGAKVIQSHENVGCQAKFIAALATKSDYVLFHDNDKMIGLRTLEAMLEQSTTNRLLTVDGRILSRGGTYRPSKLVTTKRANATLTRVDVGLGHMELIPRVGLPKLLSVFPAFGPEQDYVDDIWFSWGCRVAGVEICVPVLAEGFKELAHGGVGSCFDPLHYVRRNELSQRLFG